MSRIVSFVLSCLLVCGLALGASRVALAVNAGAAATPAEQQAACDEEGGCVRVSRAALEKLVATAYRMGVDEGVQAGRDQGCARKALL